MYNHQLTIKYISQIRPLYRLFKKRYSTKIRKIADLKKKMYIPKNMYLIELNVEALLI